MLTDVEYAELTQANPAFSDLPDHFAARIRAEAQKVSLSAGTQIFEDGDACDSYIGVLSGSVRVSKASTGGRELLLYYVHPGEFCVLTTSCLLGNCHYNARGLALDDTTAAMLPRQLFEDLVARCDPFREVIFQLMSVHMSMLMRLVEEVAFHRLDRRLASLLLDRAGNSKGSSVSATHQELAEDLGTSREIVSRILESLESQGLVGLARKRVDLVDTVRLRETYLGSR